MLNQILSIAAAAVSALSFFGFVFLSRYYEKFGIRLQDIDIPPQHFFIRGLDIFLKDVWLLSLAGAILVSTIVYIQRFRLNLKIVAIDGRFPVGFLIALLFAATFFETRNFANKMYVRDLFSETTALRKLTCLNTSNSYAEKWYGKYQANSEPVALILHRRMGSLVLFIEPILKKGEPRVELVELGLHQTDVYSHAIGSGGVVAVANTSACFR